MNEVYIGEVPRKRRLWLVLASIGLLLVVAAVVWWLVGNEPVAKVPKAHNPYAEKLTELEAQDPPSDPLLRALYFGQIGQAHADQETWDKALTNYLAAQKILDQNQLGGQFAFYQAIADAYQQKGDKHRTLEYLQKQLAYLETFQATNPDDGGATLEGITHVKEQIKRL